MSPEASRAQEALRILTSIQKEKITLSTIFFYIKYLRHEQADSVLKSEDPRAALDELYALIPKEQFEKDNPTLVVEALQSHPRRKELFPDFDPFTYRLFFAQIEAFFNEQDVVEQIHGSEMYEDTNPADFSAYATYVVANPYGNKDMLPFDMIWVDAERVIKAVVGERLKGGIGGFLGPGETLTPQQP